MAHTFGTAARSASTTANPISVTSSQLAAGVTVYVLMIKVQSATSRTGGAPTLGGVAMTQANSTQKAVTSPEASCELWYMCSPPTANTSLVIPNAGGLAIFYTQATGKAQAGMTSEFDGASGANATAINPSPGAVVTTGTGDIGFAITAGGWTTWAPTPQVGTVIANTDDGADGEGTQYFLQASPGSHTLSWTFGTSDDWGAVSAYFKEVAKPSYFTNYQGFDSGGLSTVSGIKGMGGIN